MPPWTLVSPGSRGVGFALTRHILKNTKAPVVATARRDLDETKQRLLEGLDVDEKRLEVLKVDVLDEQSISEASERCEAVFSPSKDANHLHLAYIVPGILFPEKSPEQIDAENALLTFRTNTIGPMLMMKHFAKYLPSKRYNLSSQSEYLENMPSTAVMAFMSARVGSVGDNYKGGWYSYRSSKTAVMQIAKSFDLYLKNHSGSNAMSIALHPGTTKTDLSKAFWKSTPKEQLFEPDFSAERLFEVVKGFNSKETVENGRGKLWDWNAKEIPP